MDMLDQDPAAAGELMASIGGIYDNIGEKAKARRWRSSAESIQRSLAGQTGTDAAEAATVTNVGTAESEVEGTGFDVLTDDRGMPGGDSKERNGRTVGMAPALLPVPEGMHADSHGPGESDLSEPYEPPKGSRVVT